MYMVSLTTEEERALATSVDFPQRTAESPSKPGATWNDVWVNIVFRNHLFFIATFI